MTVNQARKIGLAHIMPASKLIAIAYNCPWQIQILSAQSLLAYLLYITVHYTFRMLILPHAHRPCPPPLPVMIPVNEGSVVS